jgi:hypothetical protein
VEQNQQDVLASSTEEVEQEIMCLPISNLLLFIIVVSYVEGKQTL